jgi:hypothetical protein
MDSGDNDYKRYAGCLNTKPPDPPPYTCTECGACFDDNDCYQACCPNDPDGPGGSGKCADKGPYPSARDFLCSVSSPGRWDKCNDKTVGTTIESGGYEYNCIEEDGNFIWIEGSMVETSQYNLIDKVAQFFQRIISFL